MRTSSLTTTTITISKFLSSKEQKTHFKQKYTQHTCRREKIIYVWHCMARKKRTNRYYAFTSINISDRLVFVNDIECNSNICSVAILCFMRIFYLGNTQYFFVLRSFAAANKKNKVPTNIGTKKQCIFLDIQLSFGRTKNKLKK